MYDPSSTPPEEEKQAPCSTCGSEETYQYARYTGSVGSPLKPKYLFIVCDDCRTTSYNTTDNFTWEMVKNDWQKRWDESKEAWALVREELPEVKDVNEVEYIKPNPDKGLPKRKTWYG